MNGSGNPQDGKRLALFSGPEFPVFGYHSRLKAQGRGAQEAVRQRHGIARLEAGSVVLCRGVNRIDQGDRKLRRVPHDAGGGFLSGASDENTSLSGGGHAIAVSGIATRTEILGRGITCGITTTGPCTGLINLVMRDTQSISTINMKGGSVGGNEAVQGGGVAVAYVPSYFGSFHMADGVIYGTDHTVDSEKNRATNDYAALLYTITSSGYAQYGTFAPDGNFSTNGDLPSTNSTIAVTGGNLVSP
jgi:hypothetical protein